MLDPRYGRWKRDRRFVSAMDAWEADFVARSSPRDPAAFLEAQEAAAAAVIDALETDRTVDIERVLSKTKRTADFGGSP
jgi:hypothetical protein